MNKTNLTALKQRSLIILTFIMVLGFILRIINLNISPPGFNADEAALGYNAYSILQTGKDEWNQFLPITFKSFSDYKPGFYVYLDIPFVALFGLTELAVRLPSIILGTFSILLIYLLSKKSFKNEIIALSSAFLLAVSPWHIQYSRGAWETNVVTFFFLLGVIAFLKGLNKRRWFFVSLIAFILAMYTYQSARLVTPLLVLGLFLIYIRQLFNKRHIQVALLAAILLIPLAINLLVDRGFSRFQGVSIFTDVGPVLQVDQDRGEHNDPNSLEARIIHNKILAYVINYFSHYTDHFTASFLFVNGDPLARDNVPEMGELYLFEFITVLLGLYLLVKNNYQHKSIIFLWLLIAPAAAALTYQTPHALRAENMVVPLILISGLGLGSIIEWLGKRPKFVFFPSYILGALIIIFFIGRYLDEYYVHLPKRYGLEWEYGFSQMVPIVNQLKSNYSKVVITDRYDQPYILYLFYSQYDPALFQSYNKPVLVDKYGFSTVRSFDKFEFRPIGQNEIKNSTNTLFVGTSEEIRNNIKPLKTIYFPNGKIAFEIVGT